MKKKPKWRATFHEVTFRYEGGNYIEVCLGTRPFSVINVWDYVKDVSTCESRTMFIQDCRTWMRESADDYRRNNYGL